MTINWTKETALLELRALAEESKRLAASKAHSEAHIRWSLRVLTVLEDVFGQNSSYYLSFDQLPWRDTNGLIFNGFAGLDYVNLQQVIETRHHAAYLNNLETARGILLAAADCLERSDLSSVYKGKDTGPEARLFMKVITLAGSQLRKVVRSTPKKEKEIHNKFEDLLVGANIPYSREADRIEYSSKIYIPDFTLRMIDLAIDIKLCSKTRREKALIAEINDDIMAYRTEYGNLLFVVYDVGQIRDVDRFTASLEQEGVFVRVVKQ